MLAVGAVLLSAGLIASRADAAPNNFCSGYIPGNYYCNFGYYVPIAWMDAYANHNSYGIYRATASYPGAPSASGREYFATSGGYIYQSFNCYAGYPASHNRHSFTIYAYYTRADNCV